MGRGRQKAKATKQARDIKYYSPSTDYSALQRELAGSTGHLPASRYPEPVEDDDSSVDRYADDDDDDQGSRRLG